MTGQTLLIDETTDELLLRKRLRRYNEAVYAHLKRHPHPNLARIKSYWREDDVSMSGTAADRIEVDRLLRRVEKLAKEKSDLESQLAAKNRELEEVNARIEELQKK